MPYWIVHGLFHAKLPKSTSYITGTCWFILVPGISPIPCQILVSLPLVKTPLGCCRDTSGPAWNSLSEEASWKSAWCQNASKFNSTIPVGKKKAISGQNRVKHRVQYSGKGKRTSAVVSKCGPRNPEKKFTTGSACNTKTSLSISSTKIFTYNILTFTEKFSILPSVILVFCLALRYEGEPPTFQSLHLIIPQLFPGLQQTHGKNQFFGNMSPWVV